jgi:AcrR family transcriptional regulator
MSLNRKIDMDKSVISHIITTAERLFARQGYDQTSLRQITREADVNVASVNYYFGSKDALAEAVFEGVIARVTKARLALLDRISAEAGENAPDLERVVSSFIEPYLAPGNEDQGALMARFILKHRLSPNDATRRIVSTYLNPLAGRYVEMFGRATSGIAGDDLVWRYLMMVSTIVLTATEDWEADRLATLTEGRASLKDRQKLLDQTVGFLVAGIQSDVAGTFHATAPVPDDD